jgi:hypothetical protein
MGEGVSYELMGEGVSNGLMGEGARQKQRKK